MSDKDDNFDFDNRGEEFDETQTIFEEMAKVMVPMFKAFLRQGLSGQEAASLTAAYWQQMMPSDGIGPIDGS